MMKAGVVPDRSRP